MPDPLNPPATSDPPDLPALSDPPAPPESAGGPALARADRAKPPGDAALEVVSGDRSSHTGADDSSRPDGSAGGKTDDSAPALFTELPGVPPIDEVSSRRRWFGTAAAMAMIASISGGLFYVGRRITDVTGPQAADVPEISAAEKFAALIDQVRLGQLQTLHVRDFPIDDAMCDRIRGMDHLQNVIIDQGVVTDVGLAAICSLPNVQHIRLRLSPITDAAMDSVAACEQLSLLNLPHCHVTAAGVAALEASPRLRSLRLGSDLADNAICRSISRLSKLRSLHLIGIEVNDQGLKLLADLPALESLYVDDAAITDAGWQWLFEQHPNIHVHIDQKHHDRDPKKHPHH